MHTALKKIQARVKVLRKKHPGKKFKTLQKQAGKEYREGKLKKKHSRKHKKVGSTLLLERGETKRTRPRKVYKVSRTKKGRYKGTRKVGAVRVRTVRKTVYRRVGAADTTKTLLTVALVAGAGFLLYQYIKGQQTPMSTQYIPTGNYQRDSSAQSILTWAAAAGLTVNAIAALITALNTKPTSDVVNAANTVQQTDGLPAGFLDLSGG